MQRNGTVARRRRLPRPHPRPRAELATAAPRFVDTSVSFRYFLGIAECDYDSVGPGSIEILEHTADIGFRVTAGELDELFRTSARALIALIIHPSGLRTDRTQNILLDAGEVERLFFLWLN